MANIEIKIGDRTIQWDSQAVLEWMAKENGDEWAMNELKRQQN